MMRYANSAHSGFKLDNNTLKFGTLWNGMERCGTGWNGMERRGTARNGAERRGTVKNALSATIRSSQSVWNSRKIGAILPTPVGRRAAESSKGTINRAVRSNGTC